MITYKKYRYIYSSRPEINLPALELTKYDNGSWIGQPKLDGYNIVIFINGKEVHLYNHHNSPITNIKIEEFEFISLHRRNGWIVLNGEYMNKSKNNLKDKNFNHNFELLWNKITQIDIYEGWVLKKGLAKLKNGVSEKNNTDSQIKFRKSTKNYSY